MTMENRMSQHSSFDSDTEKLVREELLAEFSEEFDFAACQRPDGSVYGIAGGFQCRKGTPISYRPGEKHRDVMKKAQQAGLKVRSILEENDRLRQEKGLKVVRGADAVQSLARRLNERMGQPADVKGVKTPEQAAQAIQAEGADPSVMRRKILEEEKRIARMRAANDRYYAREQARKEAKAAEPELEKPSQQINKKFLQERSTQKLQAYLDNRQLYPYQRKAIEAELKRREQAGQGADPRRKQIDDINKQLEAVQKRRQETVYQRPDQKAYLDGLEQDLIRKRADAILGVDPARAEKQPAPKTSEKPYGLDKDVGVMVNKKLLGQDTAVLQQILRERSLNPKQRAKIEEEVVGRGQAADSAQAPVRRKAPSEEGITRIEGVKGYDPVSVYNRPGNVKLGEGAMGAAYRTEGPPPGVVKEGAIGEQEAAALRRLKGTGRAPEFHGAVVSSQMKEVGYGLGGHVREGRGYLGMSEAKGMPAVKLGPSYDLMDEYIKTRRDIHRRGVAHNDMHGGNFFFDEKTGRGQLVDFGLAQVSYKAALVEALNTTQGDFQAERMISRNRSQGQPDSLYRLRQNIPQIERALQQRGVDVEVIHDMGIRNKQSRLDRALKSVTEAEANALIRALYDGV
jgi:hypothetical protein